MSSRLNHSSADAAVHRLGKGTWHGLRGKEIPNREGLQVLGPLGAFLGSEASIPLNVKLYLSHVSFFPLVLTALIAGHFYLINAFNLSPLPFGDESALAAVPPERMTGKFFEHSKRIVLYSLIYYTSVAVIALFFSGAPRPAERRRRDGIDSAVALPLGLHP